MRNPNSSRRSSLTAPRRCERFLPFAAAGLLALLLPWHQGAAQPTRITIQDAVAQTLANNAELAAARLEVRRSDALVSEAWGTALPKLDLNATYTKAIMKPVFFLPGDFFGQPGTVRPVEVGSAHSLVTTVSAEQVLFNSAVFIGVGAAKTYSRGARQMYQARRVEYIARAKKAFFGVLVAREYLALARQTLANLEQNHKNVRSLASQGLVSEYDLLRSEVAVENVKPQVINAENGYRQALNNLKTVMAVGYEMEIEVEGTLEYLPVADSLLAEAQAIALARNPGLASLKTQAEVNDAIVSAQKSEFLPTLSAFGNYQYQGQSNEVNSLTDDLVRSSQVGLSLRLNIFNGWQTTARVEQAQVEYRKAQEQVTGATLNLQSATEAVLLQLNKARQRIESQGRTVEQAERGFKIATSRYLNGLGTQLEVNDAQLALVNANVNRIDAVYEYMVASADLDGLLGRVPDYVTDEKENEE